MEIKKILWPTDFSDNSNAALSYVLSLTKKYGAEIYLLYVAEDLADYPKWYGELTPPHIEKLHEWEIPHAKKKMDEICRTAQVPAEELAKAQELLNSAKSKLSYVREDGSYGAHNIAYVSAILDSVETEIERCRSLTAAWNKPGPEESRR